MEKILPIHLQAIIFGSSDQRVSKQIAKLEKEGKIRKIAPRIYTPHLNQPAEDIIKSNILSLIGHLYPGALLSHRSALEYKPTSTGDIFVTYSYTKKVTLPGVTIRFLEGPGPFEGDNKLINELYVSQLERALLENLQISKKPGPASKTLALPEIEERLEKIIQVHGEDGLNKVIGALLATRPSKILTSPVAIARAFGVPYDEARVELLSNLFVELKNREFKKRNDKNTTLRSFRNFAFFESYFSNYIEGTKFEVEEAKKIIDTQKPLAARDEDSHDVLGTYQLASSEEEMKIVPKSADELLHILQYRHAVLLSARTTKKPGQFKDKENFAGMTAFVHPELVRGTLIKGFDYYNALTNSFSRACYMMFMVSEVHPFLDGNGRIARIMMNAELVLEGESKIIIPTVYRDDYIGALRKLSRQSDPDAYIRMLEKVHQFSELVHDEDIDKMQEYLESCHAFDEPENGKLTISSR